MSVAILVDAAFFIKRFPAIYPKLDKGSPEGVGNMPPATDPLGI